MEKENFLFSGAPPTCPHVTHYQLTNETHFGSRFAETFVPSPGDMVFDNIEY
jgi:hypothetical protein